jgi:tRNA(fMet)-specific endonuclease VapC
MSSYLLDTNAWIALLKGNRGIVQGVENVGVDHLFMCSPVWAELWFGACKSVKVEENKAKIMALTTQLTSLAFDDKAAECCGEIRAYPAQTGRMIGPYDLQIASIARTSDLCLVTRNVTEFNRVPKLRIENWQIES